MIHLVTRADCDHTVRRFLSAAGRGLRGVRPLHYETLLRRRRAPLGHYIFTDYDRLTGADVDAVIALADALQARHPDVRLLNHPRRVLERVPLLCRLEALGLNDFGAVRLDTGARPRRYPVFIRSEDGCGGPETGLIHDQAGFDDALRDLERRGMTLKRRIAVGFCAEPDEQGRYRKYGAMNIGGRIIPQHIHCSTDWNVKWGQTRYQTALADEELDYLRDNPHRDELLEIFRVAGIDYGRIDYGFAHGRLQTYEINTNPALPRFTGRQGLRAGRRDLIRPAMIDALQALDHPLLPRGTVRFRWADDGAPSLSALRRSILYRRLRRLYHRWL